MQEIKKDKTCPSCNTVFTPKNNRHKYCNPNCRDRVKQQRYRKERRQQGICPQCGKEWVEPRETHRGKPGYCLNCQEYFMQRHRKTLNRKWTKKFVIKKIQQRYKENQPLNTTVIIKTDSSLYKHARKYFKSWEEALRVSGIDPKIAKKGYRKKWSKELVIELIKERVKQGKKVNALSLQNDATNRDQVLYRKGTQLFGSWENALEAAGLDPKKITNKKTGFTYWTQKMIDDRFNELCKQTNNDLSPFRIKKIDNKFFCVVVHRYKSWENFLKSKGYDYEKIIKIQRWTKEGLIRKGKELISAGEDIKNFINNDRDFSMAIYRHFRFRKNYYEQLKNEE